MGGIEHPFLWDGTRGMQDLGGLEVSYPGRYPPPLTTPGRLWAREKLPPRRRLVPSDMPSYGSRVTGMQRTGHAQGHRERGIRD